MQLMMRWGALLLFAGLARADTTWVSGEVSGIWDSGGSPYIAMAGIFLQHDASLCVEQGVRVEFRNNALFLISGTLRCNGTAASPVVFTQDTISYPHRWGGMVINSADSQTVLRHTLVEYAQSYDGAIRVNGASLLLENSMVRASRFGVVANDGELTIRGATIIGCGSGGCGGGLRADFNSVVDAENLFVEECASLDGGGLCLRDSRAMFRDCHFFENDGVIWGGAIYAEDTPLSFTRCTFEADSAIYGAGLYNVGDSTVTFDHCLFVRNRARSGNNEGHYAAVYAPGNGDYRFDNCLFYGNMSLTGEIMRIGGHCIVEKCAFIENTAPTLIIPNSMEIYYSDFQPRMAFGPSFLPETGILDRVNGNGDSTDTYGNLFVPPGFVNEPWGDFHLLETSQLIDAGNPQGPLDPDSTIADIGPFYFNQIPPVTDLTIVRLGQTSAMVLRWSRTLPALSYQVFRTDRLPWEAEREVFLGATSDTTWVDPGAVVHSAPAFYQVIPYLPQP